MIQEIKIDPKAIDPDDPELLEDTVLAAVNEALRAAQALAESKLGGSLGGLGLPVGSALAANAALTRRAEPCGRTGRRADQSATASGRMRMSSTS